MTRHAIEPRYYSFVKRHGFLSLAKCINKNLTQKYGQKFVNYAKNSNTDVLKNTSEIIVQKTAVTNGDLVSNRT